MAKQYNACDIDDTNRKIVEAMARKVKQHLKGNDNYCIEDCYATTATVWDSDIAEYNFDVKMLIENMEI